MKNTECYVVFTIDSHGYALNITAVERIFRAVEVTPLPESPDVILGVINIHGRIVKVINTRKRFNLPAKSLDPKDKFVIISNAKHIAALAVDDVSGILEATSKEIIPATDILSDMENVEGIVKMKDSIIYILNLEKILSFEEGK